MRDCSGELAAGAPVRGVPEAPYTPIATPSTGTRRAAGPRSSAITLVIRIHEVSYTTVGGTSTGRSTDLLFILLRDKTDPPPGRGVGYRPAASCTAGSMPAFRPLLPDGAGAPLGR